MKKIAITSLSLLLFVSAFSQTKPTKPSLISRAGDHFMIQIGMDNWTGAPDSIMDRKTGLSRGANVYFMINKPFKGDNRFSAAFGVGVSSSNMYFSKLKFDITSTATRLPITDLSNSNRFKKYKINTTYAEIPVELRFTSDPANDNKSIKAALGAKIANILSVHAKGKNLEDAGGRALNNFISKEKDRRFFNSTRLSVTARVGYGHFSVFGSYAITGLLKDGVGPEIKPYQVGLCISGL